jgi:hypothetical protein
MELLSFGTRTVPNPHHENCRKTLALVRGERRFGNKPNPTESYEEHFPQAIRLYAD